MSLLPLSSGDFGSAFDCNLPRLWERVSFSMMIVCRDMDTCRSNSAHQELVMCEISNKGIVV